MGKVDFDRVRLQGWLDATTNLFTETDIRETRTEVARLLNAYDAQETRIRGIRHTAETKLAEARETIRGLVAEAQEAADLERRLTTVQARCDLALADLAPTQRGLETAHKRLDTYEKLHAEAVATETRLRDRIAHLERVILTMAESAFAPKPDKE